jgi:glutamate 5-kinase
MHNQSDPVAGTSVPVSGTLALDESHVVTLPAGGRRVVLKFGSRLLTSGTTRLDPERLASVARAIAAAPDQEVVIVSSGAVAAGFRALGLETPPKRVEDRQAAAAVGQGRLMKMWADAFQEVDRTVAQVLLTNDCLTDRRRYNAARRALGALLNAGIVPIVNENDTVSLDEIVVGDNDNLGAMTAALVDADLLALLTDVPGVLTGDPGVDPDARLVERASSAQELRALCFAKKAIESTGGMVTKLEAAERAGRFGIPTVIADGTDESALAAVVRGQAAGTFIAADENPLPARRHWMAVQKGLHGYLVVDAGAVAALQRRASLLPSGIVGVGGRFRRGDLVSVVDGEGTEHARGIVRFDDREVDRIRGLHTDEVCATLGVDHGHVVMRPDRMVLAARAEVK